MSKVNESSSYTVEVMKPEDIEVLNEIYNSCNWTVGKYELQLIRAVDSDGCFVAKDSQTGQVVGSCTGIILSDSLAFIGFYAVRHHLHGQGIGQSIWRRMMEHVNPQQRNISLTAGSPKMFLKYRDKCGFRVVPDKKVHFFSGLIDCSRLTRTNVVSIVDVSQMLDSVLAYDTEVCAGLDRRVWLSESLRIPQTVSVAAIGPIDDQVKGYCVVGPSNTNSWVLHQLYANDKDIAETLLLNACQRLKLTVADQIIMQGWDCNDNTKMIADKLGLKYVGEEPILFTQSVVNGLMNKMFALTTRAAFPF